MLETFRVLSKFRYIVNGRVQWVDPAVTKKIALPVQAGEELSRQMKVELIPNQKVNK